MAQNLPRVLIESPSPHGNAHALVETDEKSIYFYIFGDEKTGLGTLACWVRNLVAGPADFEENAQRPPSSPS